MPSAAHADTVRIACFRATTAPLRELPTRLLVAKWGETETNKGVVRVNERTAEQLPGLQAARKYDRVAIDFQHNTLTGKEPVEVAGFGVPVVVPGEGVYLENIEWTPEGKRLLPDGHYPDISPAVERDADGTVIFLHSAAAVRQGEIDGLTLFNAAIVPAQSNATTEPDMQTVALQSLSTLLKTLGVDLPENATAEQITALSAQAAQKITASPAPAEPQPEAFAARIQPLVDRLEAIEQRHHRAEVESLLAGATSAGKVVPFSVDAALKLSADELKSALEKCPAGQVPVEGAAKHDIKAFAAGGSPNMHPDEAKALRDLGLEPKDIKA